jgi:hypothetical protein
MNLKNSQLDVDNWIEHGVRYFNELWPGNLLKK